MARTAAATAAAPRAPGHLQAALLLLLLVAACRPDAAAPEDAAGAPENGTEAPVTTELRCQCVKKTLDRIHPMYIKSVQVTSPSRHCGQTEVIVTHKDGKKVCLNPDFSMFNMVLGELFKMVTSNTTTVHVGPPALVVSVTVKSE